MTPGQVAVTDAMINLDTLGLAPAEVWLSRSDKQLVLALDSPSRSISRCRSAVSISKGSDRRIRNPSRDARYPRITVHSLTQKSHDGILHSSKDKLSAVNLDHYYDTYRLVASYLAFLDHILREPEFAAAQAP